MEKNQVELLDKAVNNENAHDLVAVNIGRQ